MATYNTAFGALPSYKDIVGKQPGQYMQQQPQQQTQQQSQTTPQSTFAQLQQQGMARPAPPQAPTSQPYQQFGGSQQAGQARQAMLGQLQQQLAQPTRFDTDAFNQIRQAQAANLQMEFDAQRQMLDEEMARRGIHASSIAAGRFGDLLGQQSRALSSLDAELLQQAAQTQAQDRLAAMQAGVDFSQLAGSQDLASFEANRVAQAQQFQEALQSALMQQSQFEAGGAQALAAAQAAGQFGLSGRELDLRAQQLQQEAALQGRSLDLQEARDQAQQEQFQLEIETRKEQFYSTLSQEESQFARSLDEQKSSRLQQLGIAESQLELEAMRVMQGDRSLDMQQARDIAEIDIRSRALMQEAELTGRSLDLQQARQEAEIQLGRDRLIEESEARMQQFGIATGQLALEVRRVENQAAQFQQTIDLETAIREAEIGLRAQQIQNEYERSGQALDLDRARLIAQQEMEANRLQFNREELNSKNRQFDLDIDLRERLGMRGLDLQERQIDVTLAALLAQLGLTKEDLQNFATGGGTTTTGGGGGGGGGPRPPPGPRPPSGRPPEEGGAPFDPEPWTPESGTGNPNTWGDTNPDTGQPWAPGTILIGEGNQRWIWQDNRWVLLGEGPRDGIDTIYQPPGFF